jgi:two-component system CheB/CheR fusion protein
VLVTFIDVSTVVETEARLRNLVDELNHRVRNMLQVVTAVARHTLRATPDPEAFVGSFSDRLQALGQAHTLVARAGWGEVPLHDLLEKELEPYASAPGRIITEGPAVRLQPKVALALGMVLHELATNAAKHGALSAAEGRLTVGWTVEADGPGRRLTLRWREAGGPKVQVPASRGFGSELMHRQMHHDLHGAIEIDFAEAGVQAQITVPLGPELALPAPWPNVAPGSKLAATDPGDAPAASP